MSIEAMKQALEALELAVTSHDVLLLSDPPQDAWRARGVTFKAAMAMQSLRAAIAEASMQRLTDVQQEVEAPRVNQCAEVCERAKLCAICARGLEEMGQEPVAWEAIEKIAQERYKVGPSDTSMFYRFAVLAGNGTQHLYIGREIDCQNMARKFAGAFLDGAFLYEKMATPPRREWIGLTDGQVLCIIEEEAKALRTKLPFALEMCVARAVEAALKEKNS